MIPTNIRSQVVATDVAVNDPSMPNTMVTIVVVEDQLGRLSSGCVVLNEG